MANPPNRSFLSWRINDALFRLQSTSDLEAKKKWAKVLNDARRARGDFDHLVEAKREKLDQAGERTDP